MSSIILHRLLPAFAVMLLLTFAAGCSSTPETVQGGHPTSSADDGKVLARLLSTDSAEVAVGRYALDHLSDSKVKDYALSLIVNHQRDYDHATALESDQSIAMVKMGAYKTRQQVDQAIRVLNSAGEGNSYDVAYLRMQINDQGKAIDALTKMQPSAANDQVREELSNLLPMMKKDLDRGKTLLKDLGENKG